MKTMAQAFGRQLAGLHTGTVRSIRRMSLAGFALAIIAALFSVSMTASPALARHRNKKKKHPVVEAPQPQAPAPFASAPFAPSVPAACEVDRSFDPISKCATDPQTGDLVIGGNAKCANKVYVDATGKRFGKITIKAGAVLKFFDKNAFRMNLVTTGVDVFGNLEIGDVACPIGTVSAFNSVTVRFVGNKPTTCGQLNNPQNACPGWTKGIQVESGGTLRMYGLKGVPPNGVNWTYLSQPAGDPQKFTSANGVLAPASAPGNVIYTAARVDTGTGAWRAGDWIAIATTSFSPWETEFVSINSLGPDTDHAGATGSKITLNQSLKFYHFGGPDPGDPSTEANYTAGADKNFGVDERAEVGLISRNIILTSDSDEKDSKGNQLSSHWGGELRFLQGFNAVALQGVELQKFGKEQLGSYPIHFHMDQDLSSKKDADKLIDSNSIDHSYNKCITTHSTQNISYTNNVCARITGHIFYQEVGDEASVTFRGNLGMGAMSHSFDVNTTGTGNETRDNLIKSYYWIGDNMFTPPNVSTTPFDQFNVFDTDSQYVLTGSPIQFVTTRGNCGRFDSDGKFNSSGPPGPTPITCYPGNSDPTKVVYFEPPTGFWILNPSAKLIGNSIAGCQDTGSAYWYAPPPDPNLNAAKYIPIGPSYTGLHGEFTNNRGHGCYRGLIDDQFELSTADSIFGYQNAKKDPKNHPVVGEFDKFTVSRIRDRAIWLRPVFYFLKDTRMATNRRSISFVTSGGADGNYPGVWSLLSHSTMVGISQNNVDRFGPCGSKVLISGKQVRGAQFGCIDQTVPANGIATGGEFTERGYPNPDWNMFGFMSYDGPPLIVGDRFVNFLADPSSLLTKTDKDVLASWVFVNAYKHYEGDAAIGWLDSNQSAYPTAASSKKLTFTNVTLRHQVFTDKVNVGSFNDGDRNTAILDLDGTLSGYGVGDSQGNPIDGAFPISLNNLPFNASSNSVDECKAIGQQNVDLEGRDTATMAPSGVGQLEFEALFPVNTSPPWPANDHTQLLTFYKTTLDFGQHGDMQLHSRNGLGVWEPKVTSGYGYVVRADPFTVPGLGSSGVGIPNVVDVSLVDTVKPNISSTDPFYIQLGICYSDDKGNHPANAQAFMITQGYKSWGGGTFEPTDLELRKYFNNLSGLARPTQSCFNLDAQNTGNMGSDGCPTDGVSLRINGTCPAGTDQITDQQGQPACLYPKKTLDKTKDLVGSLSDMTTDHKLNGKPDLSKYFYDPSTGMLYLWIAQTDANAVGPSPLGNCTGAANDPPFCPQNANGVSTGESYYNCPAQGCRTYRITLNDPSYKPGRSTCPVFGAAGDAQGWLTGTGGATWPAPPENEPVLVYVGTKNKVARTSPAPNPLPHYAPASEPSCATTTSQ